MIPLSSSSSSSSSAVEHYFQTSSSISTSTASMQSQPQHAIGSHKGENSIQHGHSLPRSLSNFNNTHPKLRGAIGKKPNKLPPGSPAQITNGCLLIPVFFVAWWYWTRKMCRRVVRGLIRDVSQSSIDVSNDKFASKFTAWDDMTNLNDDERRDTSDRFVKWINGDNMKQHVHRKSLKKLTKRIVFGNNDNYQQSQNQQHRVESELYPPQQQNSTLDGSSQSGKSSWSSPMLSDDNEQPKSYHQIRWECLHDVASVELCSINARDDENFDPVSSHATSKFQSVAEEITAMEADDQGRVFFSMPSGYTPPQPIVA